MPTHRLRVGSRVHYDGDDHKVAALRGGAVELHGMHGGISLVLMSALLTATDFRLLDEPHAPIEPIFPDNIGAAAVNEARVLARHLMEAITGYASGTNLDAAPDEPKSLYDPVRHTLQQRLEAKAKELGMSERAIWRKKRRLEEYGIYGLVDGRAARLGTDRVDARVHEVLTKVIASFEQESNPTKDRLRRLTEKALSDEYPKVRIEMPPATTFNRLVSRLAKGSNLFGSAKTRRSIANRPQTPYSHFFASRPGELVLIDSTPLDAFAMNPYSFEWVQIQLTIALDLYSRSLLAWRFTPVSTGAVDAALLLYDILRPKAMQRHWPATTKWAYVGVPENILLEIPDAPAGPGLAAIPFLHPESVLIDRGRVFLSQAFMQACNRLGCSVLIARPYTPTDKAHVERVFKTIRETFVAELKGYKGPDVYSRGQSPESEAFWFLDEIDERFAEWVAVYWQVRQHDGLDLPNVPKLHVTPNNMFEEGITRAGFVYSIPDATLFFDLLPTSWRTIQHYGVDYDTLRYDAVALDDYRNQRSPYTGANAGLWPFRYDPRDQSCIYFFDLATSEWHVIPWIGQRSIPRPFNAKTVSYAKALVLRNGGNPRNHREVTQELNKLLDRMDDFEMANRKERRIAAVRAMNAAAAARDRPSTPTPPDGEFSCPQPFSSTVHSVHTADERPSPAPSPESDLTPFPDVSDDDDDALDI